MPSQLKSAEGNSAFHKFVTVNTTTHLLPLKLTLGENYELSPKNFRKKNFFAQDKFTTTFHTKNIIIVTWQVCITHLSYPRAYNLKERKQFYYSINHSVVGRNSTSSIISFFFSVSSVKLIKLNTYDVFEVIAIVYKYIFLNLSRMFNNLPYQ